jgi:hypothetical protein
VETVRPRYEYSTGRVFSLVVAIVLWFLLAFAAMGRDAPEGSEAGYLIGSLVFPLLISWVVRSLFRLVRRRPVIQPAWTPGLFWGAVVLQLLSAIGNTAPG